MGRILFLTVFLSFQLLSQQWVNLNEHFSPYNVSDINFINEETGFVLLGNQIWKTTDSGITFYKVYDAPANTYWDRLEKIFIFGNNLIVAGNNRIIKSVDLGISFTEYSYQHHGYKYFFVTGNIGWSISNDQLKRTTDAGQNWTTYILPVAPANIYFIDSLKGFLTSSVSGIQTFYKTTNGGITWTSHFSGKDLRNATIAFFNNTIGFIGTTDNVLYTSNGGSDWSVKISKKVNYTKGNIGFSTDFDYHWPPMRSASVTYDFGETWQDIFFPVSTNDTKLDVIDNSTFILGDRKGALYKTSDGGNNWKPLTAPSFNISNGFFLDGKTGWITGDHLMRTTDGGYNWDIVFNKNNLGSIWFLNENKGFSINVNTISFYNYSVRLLSTSNSGTTWDTLYSFTDNSTGKYLYFKNQSEGYFFGGSSFGKTTDGGSTWDFSNPHNISAAADIYFLDSLNGYIAGFNTGYRTTDGGTNWFQVPSLGGHNIFFIDTLNAWKASGHALMRSTNGGNGFYDVYNHGQECSFSSIKFLNQNEGYTIWNQHSVIMRTTNGGDNWSVMFNGYPYRMDYFKMSVLSSNLIYVYGDSCKIIKYTDEVVPVELSSFSFNLEKNNVLFSWTTASETNNQGFRLIRKNNSGEDEVAFIPGAGTTTLKTAYTFTDQNVLPGKYNYLLIQEDYDGTKTVLKEAEVIINIPVEFSLFQNYPNPFNPVTRIKFSIPETNLSAITIYDALGREVIVLFNEVKEPGIHEIELNAGNLPSGIYFYRLNSGNFTESKKMLLLK
jgi:photosystem II stability/assembly factor-like uncharacterized protein